MRVGKELLYNIYSVMNYLSNPEHGLIGYWSMSGGGSLLSSLLTDSRIDIIGKMLKDRQYRHDTKLDYQMNMEHIKNVALCNDTSFYTLSVQAGYLSFERDGIDEFKVFIPNQEARRVWARLLLDAQYKEADNRLYTIFANINNVDVFSKELTDFVSMVLSYNDFKARAEWVYHVFFLGLVYSLGYECKSNIEAGLGRFDIMMKSRKFNAVIEFKVSDSETDTALNKEADAALAQIDSKEYWHEVRTSPMPIYKIGIACCGKKCLVKTVLHSPK
jgi:GTP-sensing pleiotropic transcriptional regulator CodY